MPTVSGQRAMEAGEPLLLGVRIVLGLLSFLARPVCEHFFPFRGGARSRLVDRELTSLEVCAMQRGDDLPGGFIRDFHEAKSAAFVGLLVQPNAGADHVAVRFYELRQVGGSGGKGQVAKK